MRTLFVGVACLLVGACGAERPETDTAPVTAAEVEGEPIPVPGDPARASYQLIRWSEMPNGHREALTRRDGSSGVSYARREIDCAGKRFRYLGEGDTRQEAETDAADVGRMAELVPGSISSEVSEFVCSK